MDAPGPAEGGPVRGLRAGARHSGGPSWGQEMVRRPPSASPAARAGTFCQFLTGGTTPDAYVWQPDITGSGTGTELDYAVNTAASLAITATSLATAQTIVTGTTRAYDGGVVAVSFYAPVVAVGTNIVNWCLFLDGTSVWDTWGRGNTGQTLVVNLWARVTPSAASHTYSVRAYVAGGTTTLYSAGGILGALRQVAS